MVIWMTAFQYWMNPESFGFARNLGTNALIFPIGGIFFGVWTWVVAERSYAAYLAEEKNTDQDARGNRR